MRDKRRIRWIEWGKDLLILLLVCSLIALVGQTHLFGKAGELFSGTADSGGTAADSGASVKISPMRLAICQDGLRYGVQYDQETLQADYAALSTLLAEALSSAGQPERVTEGRWRKALCGTGIYLDFYYAMPLDILAARLGADPDAAVPSGSARRICLTADGDGVALYYRDEDDGGYFSCATTLSRENHLNAAVEAWSPNGAQFAFEVDGMEMLEPYTLLTVTPEPAVYAAANPLLEEDSRLEALLAALSFHAPGASLSASAGGQVVEGGDSLRLTANGRVTFHTLGDSEARFSTAGMGLRETLEYVQGLAMATAGAWCGRAELCPAELTQRDGSIEIVFQYRLNGVPVRLPEGEAAARFVVSDGAVTDFSLYLRSYTDTGETCLVLPVVQAAAAMQAVGAQGMELELLYEDTGAERVSAGWAAN